MTAAAYIRVSTEEQAREGLSLAVQEDQCRARALADGCTEIQVYMDDGYSGTSLDRPALQELLGDLESLEVVYLWRLDRLSRSVRDMANLTAELAEAGVGLVSITEAFEFSSPMGRAMLGMLSVFAEFFVDVLRENVSAALQQRAASGAYVGGIPYGYDWTRDEEGEAVKGAPLVIVPEQAEVIRSLFAHYSRGASASALAQEMRAANPERQSEREWSASYIGRLLHNPTYVGKIRYRGELYDGVHEPIVGVQLWARVQRRLRQMAGIHPRSRNTTLTPLLRCGVCGGPVHRCGTGGGQYGSYICSYRRRDPPEQRHPPICTSAGAVEAAIWAWTQHLVTEEILQRAIRRRAALLKEERESGKLARLRDGLAETEQQIGRNLEAYQAGAIHLALLTERNEPLLVERDRLRARITEAEPSELSPEARRWMATVQAPGLARLRKTSVAEQREFLARVYEVVEVHKGFIILRHRLSDIPPKRVNLPRYYAPKRGVTEILLD